KGTATRALVGVRDGHGETEAWENHAGLARRSGTAAPVGAHAPGPTGVVYRSSRLEHRPHRQRFPGPVECGGTVPTSQEGRGCFLGPLAQWAGHLLGLHTFATVIGLM